MIEFEADESQLRLIYSPERFNQDKWVENELNTHGEVTLVKTFCFNKADLYKTSVDDDGYVFILGTLENDSYRIKKQILMTSHDVLLNKNLEVTRKTFIAERGISVFRKINSVINEPIVIVDKIDDLKDGELPISEFTRLLKNFPTTTELNHYARSRITGVLKDYFSTTTDAELQLEKHLRKKVVFNTNTTPSSLKKYELEKYVYIKESLLEMLKNSKEHETVWQKKIIEFILFLFPKYIAVIEGMPVKDCYSKKVKGSRFLDLTLVDANGCIDIIEIKRPFEKNLITEGTYRDNYIPKRELSGTIVQIEKYLFHLNKSGIRGEEELTNRYKAILPPNLSLKITNPKGIVIMGRDNNFSEVQKFDFDIIKRQYSNVMDILTYDDLLRRLDNLIAIYSA